MKKLLLLALLIMGCDNNSTAPTDCFGIANGTAAIDECGLCTGGTTNIVANYLKDDCGVCGGDNTTCLDCAGTLNGTAVVDDCGVCDGDGTSCTYSVSDLEGIWMGTVVAVGDGTIINMGYEFDSQGNLLDWIEGPEVLSLNGNLYMSEIGDITGTTTTIHINGNNAEETTGCNWQGSQLVSINTIEVNMQCDWTTNDGSSGSYSVTGSLNK